MKWIRGSMWPVPAAMTAAAVALAALTVWLDTWLGDRLTRQLWFVFGVGPDGVRGVLSAIAGSIITVTGVVFSITIVALQLASTQYSPRVLRTFLDDRPTQVVLGVFIGTFTYSLLVLRTVRAESGAVGEFVPSVSATVALVLGLASVACLIFFVHHSAQSIRGAVIVERLTEEARQTAFRAFPRTLGEPADDLHGLEAAGATAEVRADRHGYLNAIEEDGLLKLAGHPRIVVRMAIRLGDFVRTGDVLATVEGVLDHEATERIRAAFVLGAEAVGENDMSLGIIRLSEVGSRALSPGINDLGTAGACLDALSEVFVLIGSRDTPAPIRRSADGSVILVARHEGYAELLELAFAPLRHFGAGIPPFAVRHLETLRAIGVRLEGERRALIRHQVALTRRAAAQAIENADERARVEHLADDIELALVSSDRHAPTRSATPATLG